MELSMQLVLAIVPTLMTGVIGWLFHKLKKHEENRERIEKERLDEIMSQEKAVNVALCALCHDRILEGYKTYKKRGGISPTEFDTITNLYEAYHALGGNGATTAVYQKIRELPIKEGD